MFQCLDVSSATRLSSVALLLIIDHFISFSYVHIMAVNLPADYNLFCEGLCVKFFMKTHSFSSRFTPLVSSLFSILHPWPSVEKLDAVRIIIISLQRRPYLYLHNVKLNLYQKIAQCSHSRCINALTNTSLQNVAKK